MAPSLVIHNPEGDRPIELTHGTAWTLGRSEDSFIVLDDTWASRDHAILQFMDSKFYVIDLGSTNGTFVNGKRVNIPVELKNGDQVTFGTTETNIYFQQYPDKPLTPLKKKKTTRLLRPQRLISVLVMDIRDFTVLSRKLEDKELSQLIGTWFGKATEIINSHGSWVDKYIGDAVMAVWVHSKITGDPEAIDPQEMLKVMQALYALYKMSDELNSKFNLPLRLQVGAGVNTGTATIGQLGAGHRPEYTAIGDTVNAAFRLESITKQIAMDVALGKDTYRFCPQSERLGFRNQEVMLKGYDDLTQTYTGKFADLERFLQGF